MSGAEKQGTTLRGGGHWIWNDFTNELNFISHTKDKEPTTQRLFSTYSNYSTVERPQSNTSIFSTKDKTFKTVGNLSQTIIFDLTVYPGFSGSPNDLIHLQQKFRKYFQRKVKGGDVEVIILQDVKDVAIYTCKVTILTPEFISYFHSQSMDNFLRALIIYFQYYFQVWNKMQARRIESKRKLRQPIVTELENIVRDDLADLRSMVARSYSVILVGIGDAKRFHHMNNKNNDSFSDRDRRLFECLMRMTITVIWIALSRKYKTLIEKELDRMLRTNLFSPTKHAKIKNNLFDTIPEEDRIFTGRAYTAERKLLHRSPAVQELIFDNHDYRMLAIGVTNTECSDPRQVYLEAAYTAPEELLYEMKIPVGILGIPRKYVDTMLKIKEISTRRKMSILKPLPEFALPPKIPYKTKAISKTLAMKPCKYPEPTATKVTRQRQCKMWRKYVEMGGEIPNKGVVLTTALSPKSLTAIRTSVTFPKSQN